MIEMIKFGDIPKAVQEGNEKAMIALLLKVAAQAKALAPVDHGELRNSIMYSTKTETGGFNDSGGDPAKDKLRVRPKQGEGYVGTAVLHGVYQEFGTRFMNAQPYLRPAVSIEANGSKAKAAIEKAQDESVKREARSGRRSTKRI